MILEDCPPACKIFFRNFFAVSDDLIKSGDQSGLVGLSHALNKLSSVTDLIEVSRWPNKPDQKT